MNGFQSKVMIQQLDVTRALRLGGALLAALALAGCMGPAPVSHEISAGDAAPSGAPPGGAQPSAIVSTTSDSLSPAQTQALTAPSTDQAYLLGPNDVISVSVYLHPELSSPQPGNTPGIGGVMITSDGSVGLPLIGTVNLNGLTIDQAQNLINGDYGKAIKDSHVTIQLVAAQSLRYYLLGAFNAPGVKYPGHALDLLDALSLGGSVNMADSDLYQAYVVRGAAKLPVDFHALLIDGDLTQNLALASGDTIVIPPSSSENAFIFGAVGKPGAIPFHDGSLSLLQALSGAGMDLPSYAAARLAQIRVIRSHGTRADFLVVDASKILNGQALPFALQPGDVVFVPATTIASWNQVIAQLVPTLTVVAGLLDPFVSIKYLSSGR
jgi:polysaccharide export outer membrane protein